MENPQEIENLTRMRIPPETSYFCFHNANPKGKKTGDCSVRAIATATGKTWDEVLDGLVELAHRYKQMVDSPELFSKYLKQCGFVGVTQPRHDNGKKFTGKEFCSLLIRSRMTMPVVATIGSHHVTSFYNFGSGDYIAYKISDIWDCSGDCVGMVFIHENDMEIWEHATVI